MTDDITLDAPETRIERFLAAAAGVEGITLDEPETRIEKYLYKIAQGGGSSGGGVLVVHLGDGNALDKTWAEIDAVDVVVIVLRRSEDGVTLHLRELVTTTTIGSDGKYYVEAGDHLTFQTNTADGYPTLGQ